MHRLRALSLWATCAAALVAACGGSDDPLPPTVAPQLTAEPASLTVSEGGSATFSAAATGSPSPEFQWFIDGSGAIAGATTSSYAHRPVSLVDDGRRFGVTASNARGSVTSALATLTVTERSWSTSALPPTGANGTAPATGHFGIPVSVVDGRGDTHLVFNQLESSGGTAVWAAIKPAGQGEFTAFTRLSPAPVPSTSLVVFPSVAVDASGRVLAVWRVANPNDTSSLVAALYTPGVTGGSWGAQLAVSTALRRDVRDVAIAASADGVFDVVYSAFPEPSGHLDIVARRLNVAGSTATWSDESVLDTATSGSAEQPRIAASGNGHAVALWNEGGAFATVKAASRTSGDWSSPQGFGEQASENLAIADVAIDAQGRGVAAMMGDATRVWVQRFEFGSGGFAQLGVSAYVHNYTSANVPPVVVAGADGRPEVLSLHSDALAISRARFDGSGWLPLEGVHSVPSDVISRLDAGMDAAGNATVAWLEQDLPNTYPLARARRYHAGLAQWRAMADLFASERVLSGYFSLTVNPDGSAQIPVLLGDATVGVATFR
jgi:hypothetical protein